MNHKASLSSARQRTTRAASSEKLLTRNYLAMCITNCVYALGHQMHYTLLPLLLESMKASGTTIGVMTTLNVFGGMLLRPFFGKQYDKRSKKTLMVLSIALVAISAAGIGFSAVFGWLAMILFFRTLQGIGSAAVTTGGNTLIAESVHRSRMSEAFGYYNAFSIAFNAISPVVGLFLFNHFGIINGLWANAALFGIATLAMMILHTKTIPVQAASESHESESTVTESSADQSQATDMPKDRSAASMESDAQYTGIWKYIEKAALPFALLVFLFFFATSAATSFLVLYAGKCGFCDISFYFTMTTVFILLARLVAEPLRRRWGEPIVLITGLGALTAGYCILTLMPSMTLINIAGVLVGLGTGLCNPMLITLCMSSAPASRYGVASSTYCLAIDLGYCISSTFWGAIIDFLGYQATFTGASAILAFSIVLCIIIFRRKK